MATRPQEHPLDRLYDALNRHDVDAACQQVTEDVTLDDIALGRKAQGREQFAAHLQAILAGFPDLHFDLLHRIVEGEWVVDEWRVAGTQRAAFMDIAPTGIHGSLRGCTISRVHGSRIRQQRAYWDVGALLHQLGVLSRRLGAGHTAPSGPARE